MLSEWFDDDEEDDEYIYMIIGLVWLYGTSTIVTYLMPNPVLTYRVNIWFVNTFCRYTPLYDQTVLFLIIQFSQNYIVPSIVIYH